MINAGQAFADAVARSSRRFRMKIFDGTDEVEGNVRSAKIHIGSTGPDSFRIGAVYSSYAEIVLDGRNTALEGRELTIKAGVLAEGGYVDITLGYFTALVPAATKYRTTFTAVGRISAVLAVTEISITETATIQQIAAEIALLTGINVLFDVGIDTSGTIRHPITGNCRDALAVIALVCGGFATETSTGDVLVSRFKDSSNTEYSPDTMTALPEMAEYDFEITGVQAVTSIGTFEEGAPVNVSIESDFITESLFEDIADSLIGFSYRPGIVMLALGDPRIEPTDVLSVTTPDEDEYTVPCMAVTHIFDGGFQTEIITPAVQAVGEVVGTIEPAVKEAMVKADDARKVAVNYLSRDSTGVMVANMADGNVYTPSTVPAGVKNTFIDEDSFNVRDGTDTLASFGEESQIGTDDNTHVRFNDRGVAVFDADGNERISIGASQKKSYKIRKFINVTYDEHHSFFHYTLPGSLDPEKPITIMWPHTNSVVFHYGTAESKDLTTSMTSSYYHIYYDGAYSLTISGAGGTLFADIYCFPDDAFGLTIGTRDEAGEYADKSVSVGDDNIVSGEGAVAVGVGLKAQYDNQAVFGEYNNNVETHALEVGNGTGDSDEDRSNAFVVYKSGELGCFVDTSAHSGADNDLCAAVTALGWDNLIAVSLLHIKEAVTKILQSLVTVTGTGTPGSVLSGAQLAKCSLTRTGDIVRAYMSINFNNGSTIPGSTVLFSISDARFVPTVSVACPAIFVLSSGSGYIGTVTVNTSGEVTQGTTANAVGLLCVCEWKA